MSVKSQTDLTRNEALSVLGLPESASEQDVRTAYKDLSKLLHPDVRNTTYLFQLVNNAYMALSNRKCAAEPGPAEKRNTDGTGRNISVISHRDRRFPDILSDPAFYVPFDLLLTIYASGSALVPFRDVRVWLTAMDLKYYFVKARWPGKITIKTFGNWLSWQLAFNPTEEFEPYPFYLTNKSPFAHEFSNTLNMTVQNPKAKYFTAVVEIDGIWTPFVMRGRIADHDRSNPETISCRIREPEWLSGRLDLLFTPAR